jgi:hypothetical protein
MAKDRTLIETFRTLVYGQGKDLFQEYGKDILKGAAEGARGYLTREGKSTTTDIILPERSGQLPVKSIKVRTTPIEINTLSVAGYAQYKELYFLYAKALGEMPSNVLTRESFEKISPGGTRITSRPQYRQSYA